MSARWWTLGVWALAAASVLYWALQIFVTPRAAPPHTQTAAPAVALRGDLSRLLGVDAPPPPTAAEAEVPADARFQLIGVVSPRSSHAAREGLALIAVDGKPAKAYRVGAVVDGDTVLQSVAARGAELGPRGGAAAVALKLTPPAPAATGVLPPATSGAAPGPQPRQAPMRPLPTPNFRPVPAAQADNEAEPAPAPSAPSQQENLQSR